MAYLTFLGNRNVHLNERGEPNALFPCCSGGVVAELGYRRALLPDYGVGRLGSCREKRSDSMRTTPSSIPLTSTSSVCGSVRI